LDVSVASGRNSKGARYLRQDIPGSQLYLSRTNDGESCCSKTRQLLHMVFMGYLDTYLIVISLAELSFVSLSFTSAMGYLQGFLRNF
jgi:hypothetical protein